MRNRLQIAITTLLSCIGLAACGSDNSNVNPVTHTLAQGKVGTIGHDNYYGFAFTLPSQGQVSFSISDDHADIWDVAIFTAAGWMSYQTGVTNQAYAAMHNNVASAADMATLPAGDWYLGFKCNNPQQICEVVYNVNAVY